MMSKVLVDTSVWLRFLRGVEPFASQLDSLLERQEVLGHELVFGELLIGDLGRSSSRSILLDAYGKLPYAARVTHDEAVALVVARGIRGRGVGWIDAHLIAAALIAKAQLWTADERLRKVAERLRIGA